MTPEHGYIYIAIGAALFASLLVAWLLGRRKRKCTCRYGVNEGGGTLHMINESCPIHGLDPQRGNQKLIAAVEQHMRNIPYAPIAGTGSRPVNPYVTREELVKMLDCVHDEMLDHQGWTHEIHQRIERLEDDARHKNERC